MIVDQGRLMTYTSSPKFKRWFGGGNREDRPTRQTEVGEQTEVQAVRVRRW